MNHDWPFGTNLLWTNITNVFQGVWVRFTAYVIYSWNSRIFGKNDYKYLICDTIFPCAQLRILPMSFSFYSRSSVFTILAFVLYFHPTYFSDGRFRPYFIQFRSPISKWICLSKNQIVYQGWRLSRKLLWQTGMGKKVAEWKIIRFW